VIKATPLGGQCLSGESASIHLTIARSAPGRRRVLWVDAGDHGDFDPQLRRERQLEGIAKAKAAGVYRGRKPSIDQGQVEKLKADGLGATEIAKRLKIGRASVYRVLAS
jgi:hypothetical protein